MRQTRNAGGEAGSSDGWPLPYARKPSTRPGESGAGAPSFRRASRGCTFTSVANLRPSCNGVGSPPYHELAVSLHDRARAAWAAIAPRVAAYAFVGPETPAFRCLSSDCPVNCCRPFTVALDAEDLARFTRVSGLPVEAIVECADGLPVVLPLTEPYVLARHDGACKFLGPDGRCKQYDARPSACRLYPYQVLLVDEGAGRITSPSPGRVQAALAAIDDPSGGDGEIVPVLLAHRACPGFTGLPLGIEGWRQLLRETLVLQFRHALAEQPA